MYVDFESAVDEKNKHKPIMLSCLAVSRIPAIQTQLRVFHSPQEEENDLRPFMDYLIQLQENVKKYIYDNYPSRTLPKSKRLLV